MADPEELERAYRCHAETGAADDQPCPSHEESRVIADALAAALSTEGAQERAAAEQRRWERHIATFPPLADEYVAPDSNDAAELYSAVDWLFPPPEGYGNGWLDRLFEVFAFVEAQPCTCSPAMIEDWDACQRCRVLGRRGDEAVSR